MAKYNKLVRDRIPIIIACNGGTSVIHKATDAEYVQALRKKLTEEVGEYLESGDAEEMVDVLEVVRALAALGGLTPKALERLRVAKARERGGFMQRYILERA